MLFPEGVGLHSVMRAINNCDERCSFDTTVKSSRVLSLASKNKMIVLHQENNSPLPMISNRDFVEKRIKFEHDGITYVFISSVPEEVHPPLANMCRIDTVMGFQTYEVLPSGQVMLRSILQSNLKLTGVMAKMQLAAAITAIPKQVQAWHTLLQNHLLSKQTTETGISCSTYKQK